MSRSTHCNKEIGSTKLHRLSNLLIMQVKHILQNRYLMGNVTFASDARFNIGNQCSLLKVLTMGSKTL